MNGAEDHRIVTASSAAFPSLGIGLGAPGMADTSAQRRQELESQVDCKQHMAVLYTLHKVYTVHTYVSTYVCIDCTYTMFCFEGISTVSACNRLWYSYVRYSNGI